MDTPVRPGTQPEKTLGRHVYIESGWFDQHQLRELNISSRTSVWMIVIALPRQHLDHGASLLDHRVHGLTRSDRSIEAHCEEVRGDVEDILARRNNHRHGQST